MDMVQGHTQLFLISRQIEVLYLTVLAFPFSSVNVKIITVLLYIYFFNLSLIILKMMSTF